MAKGTKSGSIGSMGKGSGRHFGSAISTVKDAPKGDSPADVYFTDPPWHKTVPNSVVSYLFKGKYTANVLAPEDIEVNIGINVQTTTLDTDALTWEADGVLALDVGDNVVVVNDQDTIATSLTVTREAV